MESITQEQKTLFLKAFVGELIKNSVKNIELYRLEKLIEERYGIPISEERRENLKEIVERREQARRINLEKNDLKDSINELVNYSPSIRHHRPRGRRIIRKVGKPVFFEQPKSFSNQGKKILRVPEPRLPQRLSYLKPSINASEQIDLGKLLGFAQDTNVKVIEIGGPNKNVFVSGVMGKKKTGVVLNKEEIEKIINNFSSSSKIPIGEGVNKIAYGGFILNAIVSDGMDKRFSLKKIEETKGSGVQVTGGHLKRRVYSN
jgi:hypothetical protein